MSEKQKAAAYPPCPLTARASSPFCWKTKKRRGKKMVCGQCFGKVLRSWFRTSLTGKGIVVSYTCPWCGRFTIIKKRKGGKI